MERRIEDYILLELSRIHFPVHFPFRSGGLFKRNISVIWLKDEAPKGIWNEMEKEWGLSNISLLWRSYFICIS